MMIASPTAASAAATVITKNTKTCPATPYAWAKAMKVRFTALSISSTHMKMMIALRRVSTPTTPMVNSTAEKKSDSASIRVPPPCERNGADDCREQEHARDLEGKQIFVEQWSGDGLDRAVRGDLRRRVARRKPQRLRRSGASHREHHGKNGQADQASHHLWTKTARVRDLARVAEIQEHDHEEEYDHDRAGVHEHLNGADEL